MLIPLRLLFALMINEYVVGLERAHKENNESNLAIASETFFIHLA